MIIKKTSKELSPKEKFQLCMGNNTLKMADAVGQSITIDCWALYTDTDKKSGVEHDILAIKSEEGDVFATISETFKNDFLSMVDFFEEAGETVTTITVIGGKSKAGRDFVTCTLFD